ncbi:MAG TPA: CHASE3 domain-containing protein [Puia sp.]|nr:CHASE3 domain-containing protein [Puia sp.]
MKFNFSRTIRSGYLAAFVLLLVSYILTLNAILELRKENQWVDHTRQVINNLELLVSNLKDGEIGLRGLIMMKDEKFLLPYYTSQKKVDSIHARLIGLTSDNSIQLERTVVLKGLIDKKFVIISDQLNDFRNAHLEMTPLVREKAFESKKIMDSIRFVVGTMENREDELLKERTGNVRSINRVVYVIIVALFLFSIMIIGYSLVTFNMENKAKVRASGEAASYHDQLEKRVKELNEANKELIALRSIENFASTGRVARVIAHEVKNPLTNIDLSIDHLGSEEIKEEDRKMFQEIIARNSKRINHLINDLLHATRFTELKYEKANINEVLDETLDLALDRAKLNQIRIEKKYGDNIPSINIDKDRMRIAFLNIIMNAIESTDEKTGMLVVETSVKNDMCEINITDNGVGMDFETLSKIFDPYFTSKKTGNGLGLTHTQNIILNHKGKILASSEVGKGTTFTIYLHVNGHSQDHPK